MAIKTRKIGDWLSANGQAITNASAASMKYYMTKNLNQIHDGIFIMYHRTSDGYPLMVKPNDWPSIQSSGEVADGVVVFEGGRHLVVAPTEATALPWSSAAVQGDNINYGNDDNYAAEPGTTALLLCSTSMAVSIRMRQSRHHPLRTSPIRHHTLQDIVAHIVVRIARARV